MKKTALFIFLYFICFAAFPQNNKDTIIIKFEQLSFDCTDEKSVYQSNFDNNDSTVSQILKSECKSKFYLKAKNDIDKLVQKFKDKELTKKYTEEKYIQDIYKSVHESFLVSYSVNIPFYKIFDDGTYNCVTASILYAVIFKELNIDFEIKETPTHVYLVAKPKTLNITIETTAPTFGYIMHDEKFKTSYINYMVENKMIKKEEKDNLNTNELFNKYYYNDNSITIKQLIAILIQNTAVENIQNQNFKSALNYLEKSYFIYPFPRTKFYMEACIKEVLQQNENNNKRDINFIIKLAGYSSSAENTSIIKSLYNDITLDLTEKNPDIIRYKSESDKLFQAISDSVLLNDLYYMHFMSMGLYSYYSGDDMQTINYLNKAQQIFPNNIKIKALLGDVIKKQLYKFDDFEEPKDAIDTLMRLAKDYPMILKDIRFQQLISYNYSELSYEIFEDSDKKTLDKYLTDFDKDIQSNIFGELSDEIIAAVYMAAQKYFIKQNKYVLAKEYINRGLMLSPKNAMLLDKLRLIKDSGH